MRSAATTSSSTSPRRSSVDQQRRSSTGSTAVPSRRCSAAGGSGQQRGSVAGSGGGLGRGQGPGADECPAIAAAGAAAAVLPPLPVRLPSYDLRRYRARQRCRRLQQQVQSASLAFSSSLAASERRNAFTQRRWHTIGGGESPAAAGEVPFAAVGSLFGNGGGGSSGGGFSIPGISVTPVNADRRRSSYFVDDGGVESDGDVTCCGDGAEGGVRRMTICSTVGVNVPSGGDADGDGTTKEEFDEEAIGVDLPVIEMRRSTLKHGRTVHIRSGSKYHLL